MQSKYIIDTNVPCTASKNPMTSTEREELLCIQKCIGFIRDLVKSKDSKIVLDAGQEIMKEYRKNINLNGQPSVATEFLRWVLEYQNRMDIQDLVDIEPIGDNDYEKFPGIPELDGFDPADRKFIALANAHSENPPIIQGSDCKWYGYIDIFASLGIKVDFLCEEYIIKKYNEKMKK